MSRRSDGGAGERPVAEEFFDRFPVLRDNSDAALDVIYQEFLLRRDLGERPQPEEFVRRFPFLPKMSIIAQLATDQAMRETPNALQVRRDEVSSSNESAISTVADAAAPDGAAHSRPFPAMN